jgi:hypothetical protein
MKADTVRMVREALHNAAALWESRCTDSTQVLWLKETKAALASLDAEEAPTLEQRDFSPVEAQAHSKVIESFIASQEAPEVATREHMKKVACQLIYQYGGSTLTIEEIDRHADQFLKNYPWVIATPTASQPSEREKVIYEAGLRAMHKRLMARMDRGLMSQELRQEDEDCTVEILLAALPTSSRRDGE